MNMSQTRYPIPEDSYQLAEQALKITIIYEFPEGAIAREVVKDETEENEENE